MRVKEAIMAILPELEELGEVEFGQYSPPYPNLLFAFLGSGKRGLPEFERFAEKTVGKDAVGQILLSLLQYLLIRYRRYGEYSVVKPTIKVFLTLNGWLNEKGFESEWKLLLHNFIGYLVDMAAKIEEREDCETALSYLTVVYRLTKEASEDFTEEYFRKLSETVGEKLDSLRESCGEIGHKFKKDAQGC
ncbi:hypothetical protein [Thermococcus pacificus]|uniref:Uncharacterized protein n=1 Tax=Thermococcus pacificus TaxID=71998 RepID=A0A218P9A2_9EURY|nr:hypothetical protein [Thermococcus pacificus]ASJ07365.1 hypothetical protein A3L08_08550 [Thermococcus pacificus]